MKEKIDKKPLLWSEKVGGHLFVYWRGQLIYKSWKKDGKKSQPSILLNKGWPNEWIV